MTPTTQITTSNGLRHTGMMFLSRTKPEAGTAANGSFQLQLLLFDRLGPGVVEPWRVAWSGPAADDFWRQHQADLQPGAVLQVTLERARIHLMFSNPPRCEIHARVATAELVPARLADRQAAHA